MSLAQKFSALTLATVAAVTPSMVYGQQVVAKVAPEPTKITAQDNKPTIIRQGGDWSETHEVVSVIVLKGAKDEINPKTGKPMTGQEIGDIIAKRLNNVFHTPTQVFAGSGGPDYSAVVYAVKGRLYGGYDLAQAMSSMGLLSDDLERAWAGQHPPTTGSGVLAKPAPTGPGGQD